MNPPLISVIIPCYNQANYLSEAIESVLSQENVQVELLVVNDGSTDATANVARQYPDLVYLEQENRGLSAARNTGIRHSQGAYLTFLDADDVLTPGALSHNLEMLRINPQAAFVSGAHTKVDGRLQQTLEVVEEVVEDAHYLQLLQGNYIGMHATVMYPAWVFLDEMFDESLPACEDYDLYLKLAREHPVLHHTRQQALYRIHQQNMSGNLGHMLETVLQVLERQKPYLTNPERKAAYRRGKEIWKEYYGQAMYKQLVWQRDRLPLSRRGEYKEMLWQHQPSLFFKQWIKAHWQG